MQTLIAQSAFLLWMFTLQNSVQGFGERDIVSPKFGKHKEIQKGAGAASRSGDVDDESSSSTIAMDPWQAAIIRSDDRERKPFCDGSLISDRHVLTAVHCVFTRGGHRLSHPVAPAELIVRLGAFDWADQRETSARNHRVKKIKAHGGNCSTVYNGHDDIALLVLHKKVIFGAHIDKIRLPRRGDDYAGQMARITGWGYFKAFPQQLLSVEVKIFDHDLVETGYGLKPVEGTKDQIYAFPESGESDYRHLDHGGPLSVESVEGFRVLVGVAAKRRGGDARTFPHGYMRVTYYLPWIKKAMKSI